MSPTKGIVTGLACFVLVTAFCGTAQAQTTADSFENMAGRLAASEKTVHVTTESGGKMKGKLLELSGSSFTMLVGRERRTLQKSEIQEVSEIRRHAGKGALIGTGIGAALGFVGVLAACGDCGDESLGFALAGAIAYGGMGAGIGALAGAATQTERVIYRAPTVQNGARVTVSPLLSKRGAGAALALRF